VNTNPFHSFQFTSATWGMGEEGGNSYKSRSILSNLRYRYRKYRIFFFLILCRSFAPFFLPILFARPIMYGLIGVGSTYRSAEI